MVLPVPESVNAVNRHPKTPLKASLEKNLTVYAVAAGAAGVAILAAPPAQAKIVFTPTHVVLPFSLVWVDFNHDGVNDLGFLKSHRNVTSFVGTSLRGYGTLVTDTQHNGPEDLKAGFRIGGSDTFTQSGRIAAGFFLSGKGLYFGEWAHHGKGVKNRYLGVKFMIKGKVHYGWARLTIRFPNQTMRAVLTGYAYETIANKPIVAGATSSQDGGALEPASLGHLATGASAISSWRGKSANSIQ